LVWDVYDDRGVLLLHRGNVIETSNQLDILMSRGIFHIAHRPSQESAGVKLDHQEEVSPFQLVDHVYSRLEKIMCSSTPETGKDFPARIMGLCRLLQQACALDTDAALSTIVLGTAGRYSIKHSIDVAIICEVIGQALEVPAPERLPVIAATLTENIAMTSLLDILCSQAAPLTDEQRNEIQGHPSRGVEILESFGITDPIWIDAVLKHHESFNGEGYPRGLRGEEVPLYARMIAIADVYCAKISGRSYREPLTSHKAMQFIFPPKDSRIDADIAERFVKTLGIYLPGTFLYLKNKQIAVVVRRGERIHFPIVYAVTGADGTPLLGPMLRDINNPAFAVLRIIPPHEVTIKVNRYQLWGYGEFNIRM
jgi:HD-GYP domain-containing protein (c-di-GMP phosphodiesterase class II)